MKKICGSLSTLRRLWRPEEGETSERGDVPGWVLITLMTAALVVAIWAFAGPKLLEILQRALDKVAGI